MQDLETVISGIEYKIRLLIAEKQRLSEAVLSLTEENEEKEETIKKQANEINELKKEINILKLGNTLTEKSDTTEIKLRISQLIKQIDKNIELLSKID